MQNIFEEKKKKLLGELRMLALKHNRDYYTSIIPQIEGIVEKDQDILDMYLEAIDQDRSTLMNSRKGLAAIEKITSLL